MHDDRHLVKLRAVLERTLVSFRGEPLSLHGDLSPEEAVAVIQQRLSGWSFPGGLKGEGFVFGYASARSVAAWVRNPYVRNSFRQVFEGRVTGDDTGCVLVGSIRTPAFVRQFFGLWMGFACLFFAGAWGSAVWHAIGGGFAPEMIGFVVAGTGFPLFGVCLYVLGVTISASDSVFLKEWLADCINADAPDASATG